MKLLNRLQDRNLRKLAQNDDGAAAVEFALLLPLMFVMYFGIIDTSLMVIQSRSVSHASSVAADLATQVAEVTPDEAADIMTATLKTLDYNPESYDKIVIQLVSYEMVDSKPIPTGIAFFGSRNISNAETKKVLRKVKNMISDGTGVMTAHIEMDYDTMFKYKFTEGITIAESFVMRPRRSEAVNMMENPDEDVRTSIPRYKCTANKKLIVSCGYVEKK